MFGRIHCHLSETRKIREIFTKMEAKFEPKVRVNLPTILNEVINADVVTFGVNKNRLCNLIFAYYAKNEQQIMNHDISLKDCHTLQFTLSQENQDLFMALYDTILIQNKADFFRRMIVAYADNPRYIREKIIFCDSNKLLEEAIKSKRKLKIRYSGEYRVIEPYFIIKSDGETRNYIFAYCDVKHRYANYRLANIHAISVLRNTPWEHYDINYIKEIRNNFDAFLSYKQYIKVRLDEHGYKMYQTNMTHRPKLVAQQDDIFEFECSILKARLYFPQFMQHAEILEPLSLRNWFKDKFAEVARLYS